jgi:hypothetical protein
MLRKVFNQFSALATKLPSLLAKDRVLAALVLALIAALVLTLAKREGFDPGMGMQHWGCPQGQIEYEKGCYDPKTKMYKTGKKIISTKLA